MVSMLRGLGGLVVFLLFLNIKLFGLMKLRIIDASMSGNKLYLVMSCDLTSKILPCVPHIICLKILINFTCMDYWQRCDG